MIKKCLIENIKNDEFRKILNSLENKVPFYFLSPWITFENNKNTEIKSREYENGCPYAIYGECIEMNPNWKIYLQSKCIDLKKCVNVKLDEYLNK